MTEEFKSPFRIIGGEKGNHCFFPVQIDMAGKGCKGGCSYCYARSLLEFRGNWDSQDPAIADIEKIRKLFEDTFDKEKETKNAVALREADAIRIGGMTDPLLVNPEGTYELLDLCNEYNKKYIMFTKGEITDDTLRYLRNDLAFVQISIGSTNQEWLDKCEPGAASAERRLHSIRRLSDENIRVAARMGPIIPDARNKIFHMDMVKDICQYNPDLIIGELIRASGLIAKQMNEIGYDIRGLVPDSQVFSNGTYFYDTEFRELIYKGMKSICESRGIGFSVCELHEFEHFEKYWKDEYKNCCGLL